ncbi:MAG: hypothetical protein AB7H77_12100 [Bdellovibrionales bacterium]
MHAVEKPPGVSWEAWNTALRELGSMQLPLDPAMLKAMAMMKARQEQEELNQKNEDALRVSNLSLEDQAAHQKDPTDSLHGFGMHSIHLAFELAHFAHVSVQELNATFHNVATSAHQAFDKRLGLQGAERMATASVTAGAVVSNLMEDSRFFRKHAQATEKFLEDHPELAEELNGILQQAEKLEATDPAMAEKLQQQAGRKLFREMRKNQHDLFKDCDKKLRGKREFKDLAQDRDDQGHPISDDEKLNHMYGDSWAKQNPRFREHRRHQLQNEHSTRFGSHHTGEYKAMDYKQPMDPASIKPDQDNVAGADTARPSGLTPVTGTKVATPGLGMGMNMKPGPEMFA